MQSLGKRIRGICGALMVGATVAAPVHADLATAFGYLETQQNADGSISSVDDPSTAFQATSEVLRALAFTGTASTLNQPAALASLEAEPAANTEYLARRLVVVSAAGADVAALTASLLAP